MKVILTEEQFNRVILKEQSNKVLKYKTDSFSSNNADSAHNFKQMEDQIGDDLDNFYNQGINPKISKVGATINGNGSNFTTTYNYEIIDNGSGDAWTGFFTRGSIGASADNRAYNQRYKKDPNNKVLKNSTVEERMIKFADADKFEDIQPSPIRGTNPNFTQYFVQFTKTKKPKNSTFSQNKPQSGNKIPLKIIKIDNNLEPLDVQEKFKDELKNLGNINLSGLIYDSNQVKIKIKPTSSLVSMSYIWSAKEVNGEWVDGEELDKVLEKVKSSNPNTPVKFSRNYDIKGIPGYILIFDQSKG